VGAVLVGWEGRTRDVVRAAARVEARPRRITGARALVVVVRAIAGCGGGGDVVWERERRERWSSQSRSSRELKVDVSPRLPGSSVVSCFQGGEHWRGAWRAATGLLWDYLASNITFPTKYSDPPNITRPRCYFYQRLNSFV
jgi:hypothetical protein